MIVSKSKIVKILNSGKFKICFEDGVSRIDFHQADLINCSNTNVELIRDGVRTKITPGVYSLSHILKNQDAYIEVKKHDSVDSDGCIRVHFSVVYDCDKCDPVMSVIKSIDNNVGCFDSEKQNSVDFDDEDTVKIRRFSENVLSEVSSETGVDKEEIIDNAEDLDDNGYLKREELEDSAKKISDKKQESDNDKIKKGTTKKKVAKKKTTKKKTTKKKK